MFNLAPFHLCIRYTEIKNYIYYFIFFQTTFIHGEILYSWMYFRASEEYLSVLSCIYFSNTYSKGIYYFNTF